MKITEDILNYTLSLDRETLRKYTFILIGCIFALLSAASFYIYLQNNFLAKQIENTHNNAKRSYETAVEYKKIHKRKQYFIELMEKEKNFDMKSFFESFYRDQGVQPEPKWDTISTTLSDNDSIKEVALPVVFKNLTTQKLITMLEAIKEKEIVYVKTLKVLKGQEQNITVEMTLGALSHTNGLGG